jgi:carbon monoxide dehydrogenase subunit G
MARRTTGIDSTRHERAEAAIQVTSKESPLRARMRVRLDRFDVPHYKAVATFRGSIEEKTD